MRKPASTIRRAGTLARSSLLAMAISLTVNAQTPSHTYQIGTQPLSQALIEFSKQSDIPITVDGDLVKGLQAPAINGQMSPEDALKSLLKGTGLTYRRGEKGNYMITPAVVENRGAAAGRPVLDEILVTATKKGRAENIQDVAASITAINENQLKAMQFESIADIGYKFPNATLKESYLVPGQATFFIRGVGVNHTAATMDPSVGVTINGMPLAVNAGMATDSFDLESLEVLRGPQGSLFGRNTTGGVVVLRTKRPMGEFGFEVQGTLGSYDRRDIAFGIENALVEGKLSGRLSALYKEHNGYFKNAQGGHIGESRTEIIRPTLVFAPSDSLDITLFSEYGKLDAGMPPVRNIFDPDTIFSQFIYTPLSDDLRDLDQDLSGPNTTEWRHAISEVNWDVGPGRLTAVTGYREVELVATIDIDGTSSFGVIHYIPSSYEQDQFSQEIRYAVDIGDRFNLTTGLYYFDQSYQVHWGVDAFGDVDLRHSFNDHDAYAVFTQGEVVLAENWVLTLGGRYSKENKDIRTATPQGGGCELNPADPTRRTNCNYDFEDNQSWDDFSPKIGLQWLINDTTQAYVSWTKGFKSGGYDNEGNEPAAVGPYDEEIVEAYEIGLKTDLLDGRLRINLAAFSNDYTDMQRFISSTLLVDGKTKPVNSVLNAGTAEVIGFETEVSWLATERLTLSGNLGLMSNDIEEFNGLDVDGDGAPDPELARDNELAFIPEVTYNLAIAYDIPLSIGELSLRSDYAYTGKRPGDDDNALFLDPYRSLNLNATLATHDGHYRISFFGKNVLDDVSLESGERDLFGAFGNPNKPRTWGVELKYTF